MLTNIVDVDKSIIHKLPLRELESVCNTSTFMYNLCQSDTIIQNKLKEVNFRANRIVKTIKSKEEIILNIRDDYEESYKMNNILTYVNDNFNITRVDEYNKLIHVRRGGRKKDTYIIITTSGGSGIPNYMTYDELYQFLRHLFYDDIILLI